MPPPLSRTSLVEPAFNFVKMHAQSGRWRARLAKAGLSPSPRDKQHTKNKARQRQESNIYIPKGKTYTPYEDVEKRNGWESRSAVEVRSKDWLRKRHQFCSRTCHHYLGGVFKRRKKTHDNIMLKKTKTPNKHIGEMS